MKFIPVFKRSSSVKNKSGSVEVILLVGGLIVALSAATVYSLNPKRWDREIASLVNPTPAPQEDLAATAESTPSPETSYSICSRKVDEFIKENADLRVTKDEGTRLINNVYRACLAQLGEAPVDLLAPVTGNINNVQMPSNIVLTPNIEISQNSSWESYQKAQKAKCQDEINQYTLCTSELAKQTAEYQNCLANPTYVGVIQRSCYPPDKTCYKPFCASYNY